MWRILTKSKAWPIGLDIAADGVRMMQVRSIGTALRVCGGGQWKVPEHARGGALRRDLAIQAVREIARTGGFQGRRVVSAIPCGEIHMRNFRLPILGPTELREAILERCREGVDFDLTGAKLHVVPAGPVVRGDVTHQELIVLVVPGGVVQRRRQLIEDMGLSVAHLDLEPVAVFRTFHRMLRRHSDRQVVSAAIDVSRDHTTVVVARGQNIFFIKSIDHGGNRLTQAVATQLGLDEPTAWQLRRQLMEEHAGRLERDMPVATGLSVPDKSDGLFWTVHDAVRTEADALILDIGLCLRYCQTTFGCPRIERVSLTGESACDPSLTLLLREHLDVEAEPARPLMSLDASRCRLFADRRRLLSDWGVCVGLATWGESPRCQEENGLILGAPVPQAGEEADW